MSASALAGTRCCKKDGPEFTRQGLLIVNFTPRAGAEMKLARKATDAVRSRVGKLSNKRDVDVIDGDDVAIAMVRAGFDPDTAFALREIRALGRQMRADEYVFATVTNGPAGPRISGDLVLLRDERLRQPLPDAVAPKLDSAAILFARSIVAARGQLTPERRCENALRLERQRFLGHCRGSRGHRRVPEIHDRANLSGLARSGQPSIRRRRRCWPRRAKFSLSTRRSFHGLRGRRDSGSIQLRKRDEAADHWLRLAPNRHRRSRSSALRAFRSPFSTAGIANEPSRSLSLLADAHSDDLRFVQQKWRVAYENKSWPRAISAGEVLLERDPIAQHDSVFFLRLRRGVPRVEYAVQSDRDARARRGEFSQGHAPLLRVHPVHQGGGGHGRSARGLHFFPIARTCWR